MGGTEKFSNDSIWQNTYIQGAVAFVCGALIGIFSSFTVNCTLVEITINTFFAFVSYKPLIMYIYTHGYAYLLPYGHITFQLYNILCGLFFFLFLF